MYIFVVGIVGGQAIPLGGVGMRGWVEIEKSSPPQLSANGLLHFYIGVGMVGIEVLNYLKMG